MRLPLHTGPTRVRVLHCHGFFTAMQCRMTNIRRGSSPASVTDLAPAQAATPIATQLPASEGAWTQCLRNRVCRRARTGRCNFKPVRLSGGKSRRCLVPVSAPIIIDACPTSLLAANAIRSMQFIGIDSSRLRGRIAKSVLPSFLRANWGNGFPTGELNQSGPFASGLETRMSAKASIDAPMIPMCRIKASAIVF
jgi:hypothetical protein